MAFTHPVTVEFQHCDPAGIVFYPRYFEMISATVERFFTDGLGDSFARMHMVDRIGVPTAHIAVDFRSPSRLEDRLALTLEVERIGRTSVAFRTICRCGGEVRFEARHTLVNLDFNAGRPRPWSERQREGFARHLAPVPAD